MENITGHNIGCLDLYHTSTSENNSSKCQRLLQLIDNGAGFELLDKADRGVEHEKGDDDAKVDPVLKASGETSRSLL